MTKVQGEGDYEAAKRFNQSEQAFVKAGKVEQAAADAPPLTQEEAQELQRAEEKGRSKSKGEDPQVGAQSGGKDAA